MSAGDVSAASRTSRRKVVVIGAGFVGTAVVRALRDKDAEVTLVDRNNHHLFQPFLFQVTTSILERRNRDAGLVRPEMHPSLCDSFAADSTERRRSADSPGPDFR